MMCLTVMQTDRQTGRQPARHSDTASDSPLLVLPSESLLSALCSPWAPQTLSQDPQNIS